jgi:hypothetical protein
MKTLKLIILYFTVGLFPFEGASQQILNGGFEEVYQDSTLYPPPYVLRPLYWGFGWYTLGCGYVMGEMTTDSHSGNWAVRLETINCGGPVVPALVSNRSEGPDPVHFIESATQILNARPDQIEFYYKYIPVNEDTAYYSAVLYNYPDSITLSHPLWYTYFDTVGSARGMITGTVENYAHYLSNFEYVTTEIPKYLSVYFSSNHNQGEAFGASVHAHAGTTLWIDDVELIYLSTSSENLLQETEVRIYPNPVADHFQVEVPAKITVQSMQVHDFSGRRVNTLNPQNRFHSMNELPTGMYFLTVHTDEGSVVKKLVKE